MSVHAHWHVAVRRMYDNDMYSLVTLLGFFGAQFAAMVLSARMVLPELDFSPTCVIAASSSHPGQIYSG